MALSYALPRLNHFWMCGHARIVETFLGGPEMGVSELPVEGDVVLIVGHFARASATSLTGQ